MGFTVGCGCCGGVQRRTVMGGIAAAAVAGLAPRAWAQGGDPTTMPPQIGDLLVLSADDSDTPLTPDALAMDGQPVRAWPVDPATMTRRDGTLYNLLMVSRWQPDQLSDDAKPNAADGVVALTAVCTHSACDVSEWVPDLQLMECPCHFSRFDPKANGAVVQGPAFRKLPAIGLAVADGKVVIATAFDSKVGGDSME